jgi:hypothetical protein
VRRGGGQHADDEHQRADQREGDAAAHPTDAVVLLRATVGVGLGVVGLGDLARGLGGLVVHC